MTNTHGKNTKKHSLCTESIFICSLHTTEINLRLFLEEKKSIDENRWNVCIQKRLCLPILCMPIHVVWFFFIIIVTSYLYIFALMLLKENVMNILYICKLKRFCLIISFGQTLFWNRLLIPGDSRTHTSICQRYWVKCFESQLRLCHLIWLFLNGFHHWRENTTRMHHLCRYTSFVEWPDSRERAKHHSMSEISDLLSAIKRIVHPKLQNLSLFTPKVTIKLVHITCA